MELMNVERANLRGAFPLINYGIFDFFSNMPYDAIVDNVTLNNTLYFTFGNRKASPVLMHFMCNAQQGFNTPHSIVDADAQILANMIKSRYYKKWKHYAEINNAEYNPIENYNMKEQGQDSNADTEKEQGETNRNASVNQMLTGENDNSIIRDNAANRENIDTDTNNSNSIRNTSTTGETDGAQDVYGFNSASSIPLNTASDETRGNASEAAISNTNNHRTGIEKLNASESALNKSTSKLNQSNAETMKETDANNKTRISNSLHNLTRSGNIGVTTTQQMLQQERDFWNWSYISEIVHDVANFLTISVY